MCLTSLPALTTDPHSQPHPHLSPCLPPWFCFCLFNQENGVHTQDILLGAGWGGTDSATHAVPCGLASTDKAHTGSRCSARPRGLSSEQSNRTPALHELSGWGRGRHRPRTEAEKQGWAEEPCPRIWGEAGLLWGFMRTHLSGETAVQEAGEEAGMRVQGERTKPEPGSGLWGWRGRKETEGPGVKRAGSGLASGGGEGDRVRRQ